MIKVIFWIVAFLLQFSTEIFSFSFGFPLTMMALFIVMYIYAKPLGFAIEDLSYYAIEVFERLFLELRDG